MHLVFFAHKSQVHQKLTKFHEICNVLRQVLCAPASQAPAERLFSISGLLLSRWRRKTSDNNFENILFANVNFETFDTALRKRKQPDGGDNVIFVIFFYLWSFRELKAVVHDKAVD